MKQLMILTAMVALAVPVMADTFGTGDNQFTIDFVPISGSTNPTSGIRVGMNFFFTGVNYDYRMGTHEITNGQWDKFRAAYGAVSGSPSQAYDSASYWTGTNVPTNEVSWYEAAQFVNWLNTSTGHHIAYKFTGTQGASDYTFGLWNESESAGGTNLFRHKDAFYFLPTENEWVKAAYWNGASLQKYATQAGQSLLQGDGVSGTGWNYYGVIGQPWNVGSGSQELNGTYDMMGNVSEWMENTIGPTNYLSDYFRAVRGGSYELVLGSIASSGQSNCSPVDELWTVGFRVASIPEPCTLLLLGVGGMLMRKNFKKSCFPRRI